MQGAPTEEGGMTIGGPGSDGSSPGSTVFVDASEGEWDCLSRDEWQDGATWEYSLGLEATIEDEKPEKTPCIGDKASPSALLNPTSFLLDAALLAGNFMFDEPLHVLAAGDQSGEPVKRIMTLAKHYAYLRRTRADGNCFFRSFMFSYLEHVLETQDRAEVDRIQSNIDKYKKTLQDLGCPGFAIQDC
ncbi:hypothetical protein Taro_043365 [Colocasia esculenta]|uniref:OTU domain-containing protein n=1 Tax=Colocasia esculenta TaxID=4460 RepID=A0A843WRX2_COLES|nr:hypothetical protein [Colocasia esculenta]